MMSRRSKPSGHNGDGHARGELLENDGEWTIVVEIPHSYACYVQHILKPYTAPKAEAPRFNRGSCAPVL